MSKLTDVPAPDAVTAAIIDRLVEARLISAGNKDSERHLRALAAVIVAGDAGNVVGIKGAGAARIQHAADAWLRERLVVWMARHG